MKSPFRINTLLVVFILSALVVGLACVPSGSKKGSISNDRDDGNLLAETGDSVLTVASCVACHREATDIVGPDPDHPFNQYIGQTRTALADSLDLSTRCGVCHAVASPELVSKDRWSDVIVHMRDVFRMKSWPVKLEPIEWLSILHYYAGFAPTFAQLPSDPAPSGLLFTTDDIGTPK